MVDSIGEVRFLVSADLKKQIFQLTQVPFRTLDKIQVLYPRAQQQPPGRNSCGLHAIADITNLVFGGKPSKVRFVGLKMR